MRVVFLDRDGVINRNREDYVKSVEEFEFLPGALEALKRLTEAGWDVVVISNQAGVGKGLMTEATLEEIDRLMLSKISEAGGSIAATYYCAHRQEENCGCRKPAPGLILRASRELGLDPKDAVLVGDSARDVLAGQSAGCRTVVVLSGQVSAAEAALLDPAPDFIAADLGEAVDWIISDNE
ncbi:MAG: D-glycero-beta-D-manno-heptose 1,7-bisphosphate 7-phosphatase [Armatimonadetes bacterium]|nr:D-glycero-beta-D-manno-heptose 1,7-bisphosphate 7-phosphatase [Armatimonadota bacterium]